MASASYLIWSAVTPLLQTYITMAAGFILAKVGMWNRHSSRAASLVCLKVALPCLIFSNIVPSFNSDNISALGPLFCLAFIYIAVGGLCGWLIREFTYVPLDFKQGVFVLNLVSNWGNLPTAMFVFFLSFVQLITKHDPFDPNRDPSLGISYVSIFILCYNITYWVLPTARSLRLDYRPDVPHGSDAEVKVPLEDTVTFRFFADHLPAGLSKRVNASRPPTRPSTPPLPPEMGPVEAQSTSFIPTTSAVRSWTRDSTQTPNRNISEEEKQADDADRKSGKEGSEEKQEQAAKMVLTTNEPPQPVPASGAAPMPAVEAQQEPSRPLSAPRRVWRQTKAILNPLRTPVVIAMAVSIPTALIPPLKALFTHADATTYHFGSPNGDPPLGWLLDTASFIGGIAIPLSVIQLGGSFAEIKIPRPLSRLPWTALLLCAFSKMALMPVIGVLLVQAFSHTGFIDKSNVALRFVAMFLSGTPAAVNQLTVTQLYAGENSLSTLSTFLLVQYVVMLFSSAILIVVSLKLL